MATLYVVGTPIGNLSDLSPRGREVLTACGLIAAEDTRVTRKLLSAFDIHTPLVSCHAHNQRERAGELVARMAGEGIDIALVTDAGMPGISDPGSALVAAASQAGLPVVTVPGPSAVTAAISLTGWDITEYGFYAFLPRSKGPLMAKLKAIALSGIGVAVCYESPHRVVGLMEAVCQALPGALACVCCDLTKKYELSLRGEAPAVLEQMLKNPNVAKGEYAVVLDLRGVDIQVPKAPAADIPLGARIAALMLEGMTMDEACGALKSQGEKRNALYQAAMALKALGFGRKGE